MDYQLLILGAGPGGYVAAIRAAQLGLKTAIVESRDVGGTCLNRGCIPTKTLLHSAQLVQTMRDGAQFGVHAGEITVDFEAIHARKAAVSEKLRGGIEQLLQANKVELLRGTGTICAAHQVGIDGRPVTAEHIVIATGSVPARPAIPGLALAGVVTSDELLEHTDKLCRSLLIIGGGVIGMEFASVYAALGVQVTVIEAMERILPTLDREFSQNLSMILKKRGVQIFTGCSVQEISAAENGLNVRYVKKDDEQTLTAETVLVSIGRRPNTTNLFAEGVSVEMERGRILVDDFYQTSLDGVYAIGDVSSKIQLAHAASAQGAAVAERIAGLRPTVDAALVPSCIYTAPEIASVGMTAEDAKAAGIEIQTGKFVMFANGKTLIENGERGFIKVLARADDGKILGAQMMCERATDMISEFTTAIANGLTAEQMLRAMRPHPTFNEAVTEALEDLSGHSIHAAPKRK